VSVVSVNSSLWTGRTQAPRLRRVSMLWWFLRVRAGFWFWRSQMVDIAERGYNHLIQPHSSFLFPIARYFSLETRAGRMPLTNVFISKAIIRSLLEIYFICEKGEQIPTYVRVMTNGRQCKRIEHEHISLPGSLVPYAPHHSPTDAQYNWQRRQDADSEWNADDLCRP